MTLRPNPPMPIVWDSGPADTNGYSILVNGTRIREVLASVRASRVTVKSGDTVAVVANPSKFTQQMVVNWTSSDIKPTPPPVTVTGADFDADPNVSGSLRPWDKFDPGNAQNTDGIWVNDQYNGAQSPGIVCVVDDPLGLQGKVIKETVTPNARASTASGSDSTYLFNYAKSYVGNVDQENWIHFRMMLPGGYKPTPGEWNIFNEFHNNSDFQTFYNKGQIAWEFPEIALYVTAYTSDVPHLMYRVRGGKTGSNNFDGSDVLNPNPLQLNHWYDHLLHIIWKADNTGLFEWWLDGQQQCSLHRPTLWQRPDNTYDKTELELNHYRQHSTYDSTVYYGRLKVGKTKESVAF